MMKALVTSVVALSLWPVAAIAKSVEMPDIRAVETESTDIFEVLQRLSEADAALEGRAYLDARNGYESVLAHDPSLKRARTGLRRTLLALGDVHRAATYVDDPASADAILINVLSGQSRSPEADLKRALKTHQDPRLWNALGHWQDRSGAHDLARQAYAMAGLLGQRPGLADNNIGQSHLLEGDVKAALIAFSRAHKADPSDIRFDNNRRRTLVLLGETKLAIAGLTADRAALFLTQAGDQARREGEIRLARFFYRRALDLSPRHLPETDRKLAELDQ